MKTVFSILIVFLFSHLIVAQNTAIPDPIFEQALIDLGLDKILDGQVLTTNIDTITSLDIGSKNISNLTGIKAFTKLTDLSCGFNQLTSLDVSNNKELINLSCGSNQLTNLDFTKNIALTSLSCFYNPLISLDVTQNTNLMKLYCGNNELTSLDVTQNTALTIFFCNDNQLTNLDVTQNTSLTILGCQNNQLISLNVTQNTALTDLGCYNNQLPNLDVTKNIALTELGCRGNQLNNLDLTQNTVLTVLDCMENPLTCLNVKNGNNNNFTGFFALDCPNLSCIEVDDPKWSTTNWTYIDTQTSFSTNCTSPCVVGIELFSLSNLSIYPNPTIGNITINLGESKQGIKATLTNNLGQILFNRLFESTNIINIDIDALTGIYFLKIETTGGETKIFKVLKE